MKMYTGRFRDERKQGQSKGLFLAVVTYFWLLDFTEIGDETRQVIR